MRVKSSDVNTLVWAIIIIVAVVIAIYLVRFFIVFSRELNYIEEEILRTTGEEREYWKKTRRRLWLSLLPFVKY